MYNGDERGLAMTDQSPEEKNKGKMNEHLANERTFLAWIRTGIATVSLGFVIARFSFWLQEIAITLGGRNANIPRTGISLPIGLGMMGFGALVTLMGAFRYRTIHHAIENDLHEPRTSLIFVTTGAVILIAIILIVDLIVASRQF